jgi:hypothetical protein
MGRRRGIELALLMALPACASDTSIPFPMLQHVPVLMAIPDANLLQHGQYRLQGRFQYFTGSEPGSVDTAFGDTADPASATQVQNLNYNSELQFGIENRAEVGIQYGRALSFSVKALVWREDLFWPDIVFGARNLFGSQEGGLYGVTDSKTLKDLQSESYMTLGKSFAGRSRAHLGFSVLNRANKGFASINAGLEQDLGAGAHLGYEVFERFSDFHQVLTLQWRYRNLVGLSVAMTEFQSWIRQDGEWGFFLTPSKNNPDGYNSPGIAVSLQVLGWVPHRTKRTLPERVAILEVKNAELEKQVEELDHLKQRMAELEQRGGLPAAPAPAGSAQPAEPAVPAAAVPLTPAQQAVVYLKALAEKGESDLTDPKEMRDLMAKVAGLGPEGAEVVKRAAADTGAGPVRVHAVLVMAFSKDPGYEASLRALCADGDPRIRREALTALVKLGSRAALEDAKRLLSDPDETVAMAAGEAYRQLKGPAKQAPAARKRAK